MTPHISSHVLTVPELSDLVQKALGFFDSTPLRDPNDLPKFKGPGVYALYYDGTHKGYNVIVEHDRSRYITPIYVGKAVPPGWRQGRIANTGGATPLHGRLREHIRNINQVDNLEAKHFRCRFMIMNDLESNLIASIEAFLIRRHRPLWNSVVDGFGNHDPGSGRYNQAMSEWDVLHPGRPWALRLTGKSPSLKSIRVKVRAYEPLSGDTNQ